jgi:peptidoglycan/LPS O-acetylase OafA/YrhL
VTLDGLRGVAALAIAARHVPFLWPLGYPTGVLQRSYLAVDFFFVLSGFVLSHAYSKRFETGMTLREFMIARLVRIYPLYALALILAVLTGLNEIYFGKIDASSFGLDVIFAVLFAPSLMQQDHYSYPLNYPAWSLFCELVANTAFGAIGKRLIDRALVAIVAAASVFLILSVSLGWFGFDSGSGVDAGWARASIGAGLVRVAYSFFAGALVFRLWKVASPKWRIPPLVLVATLCAMLAMRPPAQFGAAFDLMATLIVFPALVFLGAACKPGARVGRLFAWFGGISYGVYVLQAPVYNYAHAIALAVGGNFGAVSLSWAAMSLALVVVVATAADDYIDRPVRARLIKFFRRPRRPSSRPKAALANPSPRSSR